MTSVFVAYKFPVIMNKLRTHKKYTFILIKTFFICSFYLLVYITPNILYADRTTIQETTDEPINQERLREKEQKREYFLHQITLEYRDKNPFKANYLKYYKEPEKKSRNLILDYISQKYDILNDDKAGKSIPEEKNYALSLHHKNKEKNLEINESIVKGIQKNKLRLDWWKNIHNFHILYRVEIANEYFRDENSYKHGTLAYQQLKYRIKLWELTAQITYYESDVQMYMYENNVEGVLQNSVLSGNGLYSYLALKYIIWKNVEIQGKITDHWLEKEKMRLYFQIINRF
jgi:hypothetical protein